MRPYLKECKAFNLQCNYQSEILTWLCVKHHHWDRSTFKNFGQLASPLFSEHHFMSQYGNAISPAQGVPTERHETNETLGKVQYVLVSQPQMMKTMSKCKQNKCDGDHSHRRMGALQRKLVLVKKTKLISEEVEQHVAHKA